MHAYLSSAVHFVPSVGFPPTFGPCFINLYGSTREYYKTGCDEYDDINQGKVSFYHTIHQI